MEKRICASLKNQAARLFIKRERRQPKKFKLQLVWISSRTHKNIIFYPFFREKKLNINVGVYIRIHELLKRGNIGIGAFSRKIIDFGLRRLAPAQDTLRGRPQKPHIIGNTPLLLTLSVFRRYGIYILKQQSIFQKINAAISLFCIKNNLSRSLALILDKKRSQSRGRDDLG